MSKLIFFLFIFAILQQSKNNSCFVWEQLILYAMSLIFSNVLSTCFNPSFTIKFKYVHNNVREIILHDYRLFAKIFLFFVLLHYYLKHYLMLL